MKEIPLYSEAQARAVFAIELTEPTEAPQDCELCPKHVDRGLFPIPDMHILPQDELLGTDEFKDHGVPTLCVFSPTAIDVSSSSPNSTKIISDLEDWFTNNMPHSRFAMATRCGTKKSKQLDIEACRPHLHYSLKKSAAKLILCFGMEAWEAVVGTKIRRTRSYAWSASGRLAVCIPDIKDGLANTIVAQRILKMVSTTIGKCIHNTGAAFPPPPCDLDVLVAENRTDVQTILSTCSTHKSFAFDVETYGRRFHDDDYHLLSIAIAITDEDVFVIPKDLIEANKDLIRRIFTDPSVAKYGQNVKFDNGAIRQAIGCSVEGIRGDSRLFSKLLENTEPASLSAMSALVGMGSHKDEAHEYVRAEIKRLRAESTPSPGAYAYAAIPDEVLWRYNALDAVVTFRLCKLFVGAFSRAPDLKLAWKKIVCPASDAITDVEVWGMPVDKQQIETLSTFIESKQTELKKLFDAEAINPDSSVSVGHYLFQVKGYPVREHTAGGRPSVNAEVLRYMEHLDPIITKILEWRKIGKVRSTYAEGLLPYITAQGRIHPDLLLDGTASGRLSCREPNLQNIPRADTELGKAVRLAFRPKPGLIFIQADYSQLELRVAAMLSGDDEMIDIFKSGIDYHQRTAELVSMKMWGIKPEAVEKKHRQAAKTFNFGLLYGMSDAGIAKQIGVSADEAHNLRIAILGKFSKLADWINEQISIAKSAGYASTYYDGMKARRRWLPDLFSTDKRAKSSAERSTWNTPVQGTASDICLRSLIEIVKWIKEDVFPGKVVSTVHDSIMLEVEEESLDEAAFQLKEIMTQWDTKGVPLVVDMEFGPSWAELSSYNQPEPLSIIVTEDTEIR